MTNIDIRLHAARCAAAHTGEGRHLEPDEAWLLWSSQHGISGPGARLVFEREYALCRERSLWGWIVAAAFSGLRW
jgi:hypothetical protein